jgi:hypothetical protein
VGKVTDDGVQLGEAQHGGVQEGAALAHGYERVGEGSVGGVQESARGSAIWLRCCGGEL